MSSQKETFLFYRVLNYLCRWWWSLDELGGCNNIVDPAPVPRDAAWIWTMEKWRPLVEYTVQLCIS